MKVELKLTVDYTMDIEASSIEEAIQKANDNFWEEILEHWADVDWGFEAIHCSAPDNKDLFEDISSLPEDVQEVINKHSNENGDPMSSEEIDAFASELEFLWYEFDYWLDMLPINLRKIS